MKRLALTTALLCCACATNVHEPGQFAGRYDFDSYTDARGCAPNIYPLALCLNEDGAGLVSVRLISSDGDVILTDGPDRVSAPLVGENAVDFGLLVDDPDNERSGSGAIRVRVYAEEPPVLGALWHLVYPADGRECSGEQDAIGEATVGACN